MNRTKRSLSLISALLCLALLCACGGTANAQPDTTAPAQSISDPAETAAPTEAASVTVTDDLGVTLSFDAVPQRVAVLTGSFTETWLLAGGTLCAAVQDAWDDFDLGLGDEVVNLGSYKRLSMELLFEAEPELVIASANTSSHVELRDTLDKAGIPSLYFNVNGFADYLRMLSVCTAITGRSDLYAQNGAAVERQVTAVQQAAAEALQTREAPHVLFLRVAASNVRAKGSDGTVLGEMLCALGCVNIADGSALLEDLSIETIIEEDPEYIFLVQQGDDTEAMERLLAETLTDNPAWAGLTAVREGRMYFMDKHLFHFKPNARWGEAYEQLFALLYGA